MQVSVMALFVGAVVFSYAFFVFFAGNLNPIVKPKRFDPAYRRVSYFRYIAGALLLCSILAILVYKQLSLSWVVAGTLGVVLFALLTVLPTLRYNRLTLRQKSADKETDQHVSLSEIKAKSPTIRRSLASNNATTPIAISATKSTQMESPQQSVQQPSTSDVQRNFAHDLNQSPPSEWPQNRSTDLVQTSSEHTTKLPTDDLFQNSTSEEYELEMAIRKSTAHIDDNLTDMDQSIAEAEFEAVLTSEDDASDAARPDFPGFDSESLDSIENELEADELDLAIGATGSQLGTSEEDSRHVQKIASLERENASLSNAQESLKGEVARLELGIRQQNAIVRKNIALKDHALEVKDKALTIAAMERKKRKLTEIKAQKIILKLKNNMRQLEHDSVERQL